MRHSSLAIIFLVIFTASAFPQQSQFFDAPFGGGGGYTPGWYMPNVDAVNSKLEGFGVPKLSNGGFYTSGGAGFIYLGFLKFCRIGGMGFGGSYSSSSVEHYYPIDSQTLSGYDLHKKITYSLGGGGLTFEYTLPFVRTFGISAGAMIGMGSLQIDIYKNTGSMSWDNTWSDAGGNGGQNQHISLKNNFWMFSPTLNIDVPIYRMVVVRLGMGYQFTFGGSWSHDDGADLTEVPSSVSGNCFFIQSGVFIGLFSF